MPINVFGNSSNNSDNKVDTMLFIKKPYLRTNYIESDIDQDIDLKDLYRIKNRAHPINDKDSVNKIYVDNKTSDMIRKNIQNNDYVSFIDNNNTEYNPMRYRKPKYLTDETVTTVFWARVLCSLAAEAACFRLRITLGVVLIRSLVFHVCVPECSRNGSGKRPYLWVQEKFV